jgi:hypothetical protein
MEGPSGVVALVLAETAAGSAVLLWFTRLWGAVKRGYFILVTAVALACALLATLAASGSVGGGPVVGGAARVAVLVAAAVSALLGLSLAALILRLDAAGRVLGIGAALSTGAALLALARVTEVSLGVALVQLLAGAAFMGAVTDGLLLGHWYLVDRRLVRHHIRLYAVLLLAAVVLEAVAVATLGFRSAPAGEEFSPFLRIAGLATWLSLGMVACTALIAVLIRATLRSDRPRAVQAATGFFYLAVITAFTAEMAAKTGFVG